MLPIFDRVRVKVKVRFNVQIKYSNSMIFKNSLSVSWPVRELSSPRLDWPRVGCPVSAVFHVDWYPSLSIFNGFRNQLLSANIEHNAKFLTRSTFGIGNKSKTWRGNRFDMRVNTQIICNHGRLYFYGDRQASSDKIAAACCSQTSSCQRRQHRQ